VAGSLGGTAIDRLRSRDLRALLEFLHQAYAIRHIDEHTTHVVADLPKVIRAEITGYTQADLRHRRIKWSVVSRPELNLSKPDMKQIVERHLQGNPVVPYYLTTRDARAVTISDFLTRQEFHRLPLYNEWYRSMDVEYQLSVPLQTSPDTLSRVSLSRDRRDFSARERLLLDVLRPHLLQAYRNAEAFTSLSREHAVLQETLGMRGQEVVYLSGSGRIKKATPRARQWLATYFDGSRRRGDRLPDALGQWIRRQQTLLQVADDAPRPREPLAIERDGTRLVVRLLPGADEHALLLEEECTSPDPRWLESLGLGRREAEVLAWVSQGKTNDEIATILSLSRRTVEKHLENIYPKLGVENRTAAAARALAVTNGASHTADGKG
jgi:DNA-binding CsgD family transcriptional regulator